MREKNQEERDRRLVVLGVNCLRRGVVFREGSAQLRLGWGWKVS